MVIKKQKKDIDGFTLIELMIVIGLLVIFTALTIPYGLRFFDSRNLEEETTNITTIIKRAQSHAISGKEDSNWGVQIVDSNQYNIFKGDSCGGGDIYQVFNLSEGTEIESDINCIIFERHTGDIKIYD